MFSYFYHASIRKTVVAFGTLFNNLTIKRFTAGGVAAKTIKVPISYGPKHKFIRKQDEEQSPQKVQVVYPRMSFEYNAITYDPLRKLNTIGKFFSVATGSTVNLVTVTDGGSGYTDANPPVVVFTGGGTSNQASGIATVVGGIITGVSVSQGGSGYTTAPTVTFDNTAAGGLETTGTAAAGIIPIADILDWAHNPVPFNFNFDLNIAVKHAEDGTQIIEQILPYFTPEFNVVINEIPELGIKRDIQIIFQDVSVDDVYEGAFDDRRSLLYTITFIVKTNLYGPVRQGKIIKSVTVNTKLDSTLAINSVIQNVVPDPLTADADDNFGFTETITENL